MKGHPAKFSGTILDLLKERTSGLSGTLLDPFAGTGRVHELAHEDLATIGVELEPEWAELHPRTIVGNALHLPFPDGTFDVIVTSPCMERSHRILTSDLRWVMAGDIKVGDTLVAFDEFPSGQKANGANLRRKWAFATVVRSIPDVKPCVKVVLANGEELITTPEHPWLAKRSAHSSTGWISSRDLIPGTSLVARQLDTWEAGDTYDDGWVAGMMDGEGSLSLGVYGSPKLVVSQVLGEIHDRYQRLLDERGFSTNSILREKVGNRRTVGNVYVTGGFPGLLKALGLFRPKRLLQKWEALDISTRCIQPEWVEVVSVEEVGEREIQVIETTSGTYISEGYLMHNCYGNRMADHHNAKDGSERNTYTHQLERPLHEDNSGKMQWGDEYRVFHRHAWKEVFRVSKPGTDFFLNISDHIRKGEQQLVTDFHLYNLLSHGWRFVDVWDVETPRQRQGANGNLRTRCEYVFHLRKSIDKW